MVDDRIRAVVATAVAALSFGTGCATAPGTAQWDRDLLDAEARWHAAAPRNYTFSMLRSCHCVTAQTRQVTIVVRNGAFASLVYADSLGGAADTTLFQQYLTIDRYFTLLHQVVASGPAAFGASYNQSLGFPIQVVVDPDRSIVGDEFQVDIYAYTANTP